MDQPYFDFTNYVDSTVNFLLGEIFDVVDDFGEIILLGVVNVNQSSGEGSCLDFKSLQLEVAGRYKGARGRRSLVELEQRLVAGVTVASLIATISEVKTKSLKLCTSVSGEKSDRSKQSIYKPQLKKNVLIWHESTQY